MKVRQVRSTHDDDVTLVPDEVSQSRTLSLDGIGLLAHLLTLPPDSRWAADEYASGHATSRRVVRRAAAELQAAGWLQETPDGSLRLMRPVGPPDQGTMPS